MRRVVGAFLDVSNVVYTDERSRPAGAVRYHPAFITAARPSAALSETLTRLVQQSALADEAAIILWNAGNHRAASTPAMRPAIR